MADMTDQAARATLEPLIDKHGKQALFDSLNGEGDLPRSAEKGLQRVVDGVGETRVRQLVDDTDTGGTQTFGDLRAQEAPAEESQATFGTIGTDDRAKNEQRRVDEQARQRTYEKERGAERDSGQMDLETAGSTRRLNQFERDDADDSGAGRDGRDDSPPVRDRDTSAWDGSAVLDYESDRYRLHVVDDPRRSGSKAVEYEHKGTGDTHRVIGGIPRSAALDVAKELAWEIPPKEVNLNDSENGNFQTRVSEIARDVVDDVDTDDLVGRRYNGPETRNLGDFEGGSGNAGSRGAAERSGADQQRDLELPIPDEVNGWRRIDKYNGPAYRSEPFEVLGRSGQVQVFHDGLNGPGSGHVVEDITPPSVNSWEYDGENGPIEKALYRWLLDNTPERVSHPRRDEQAVNPPDGWEFAGWTASEQKDRIAWERTDPPLGINSESIEIVGYPGSDNYRVRLSIDREKDGDTPGPRDFRTMPENMGLNQALYRAADVAEGVIEWEREEDHREDGSLGDVTPDTDAGAGAGPDALVDDRESDVDDQAEAVRRMVEQDLWNPSIVARAFDVSPAVANTIVEQGDVPGDVMMWAKGPGDLSDMPGIGEDSARSMESTIPLLEQHGVTDGDGMIYRMDQDDDDSTEQATVDDVDEPDDRTISAVDPETGESQDVTFPEEVDGWTHHPDKGTDLIRWYDADGGDYVFVTKSGGSAWMAGYRGDEGDSEQTFRGAEEAIRHARSLMVSHDADPGGIEDDKPPSGGLWDYADGAAEYDVDESDSGEDVPDAREVANAVRERYQSEIAGAESCGDVTEALAAALGVIEDRQPSPFDDEIDLLTDALEDLTERAQDGLKERGCDDYQLTGRVRNDVDSVVRAIEHSRSRAEEVAGNVSGRMEGYDPEPKWLYEDIVEYLHNTPTGKHAGGRATARRAWGALEEVAQYVRRVEDAKDVRHVDQRGTQSQVKEAADNVVDDAVDVIEREEILANDPEYSPSDIREAWRDVSFSIIRSVDDTRDEAAEFYQFIQAARMDPNDRRMDRHERTQRTLRGDEETPAGMAALQNAVVDSGARLSGDSLLEAAEAWDTAIDQMFADGPPSCAAALDGLRALGKIVANSSTNATSAHQTAKSLFEQGVEQLMAEIESQACLTSDDRGDLRVAAGHAARSVATMTLDAEEAGQNLRDMAEDRRFGLDDPNPDDALLDLSPTDESGGSGLDVDEFEVDDDREFDVGPAGGNREN